MHWWQIKKRDADLERELDSDLALEEEEQREKGLPPKKLATPPAALSATRHSFANKLMKPGAGRPSSVCRRTFVTRCGNCTGRQDLPLLRC